ncbi:MAG TPA: nucleotidyltransferase domain-containing protein [Candidatus Acetothermia bacterium]|nr:nucleotidyltransferase domain-containing protein [Candidatus Acetothermia bacterium]
MINGNQSAELSELASLREVFRRYPGIRAVYVFGSTASGNATPESDLDLAIISANPSVRNKKLDVLSDLVSCGYCDVDLVFIDEDDLVLAYEAIRQNRLIYAVEDFDRGATYSNIVRKYLDFEPYLQIQRDAYKRRNIGAKS